jgi:hypothetical protein
MGILLMACIASLLYYPVRMAAEGRARVNLNHQMRIVRERMLRGVSGQVGLRSARRDSIDVYSDSSTVDWVSFRVDTNPVPTLSQSSDDLSCWIFGLDRMLYSWWAAPDGAWSMRDLLRGNVRLRRLDIRRTEDELALDLALETQVGGKTVERAARINVAFCNQ